MKYLPHGTTFTINAKAVGGLISVTLPEQTRGEAETTDSNSGFNRSFMPGLREGGTVELTFRHDPTDVGQLELESNFGLDGSNALKECVITLPTTAKTPARTYTFIGFVSKTPSGELGLVDDTAAQQAATVKVAGLVTIA